MIVFIFLISSSKSLCSGITYNNSFYPTMTALVIVICLSLLNLHYSIPNCMKSYSAQGALGLSTFDMINNFQSGSVKLLNYKNGSRYHFFNITFAQKFNVKYHATVSFQNIVNFEPGDGLDFFITSIMNMGSLKVVLAMDRQAKWTWIEVCFAVSSRNDFGVGFFIADNAHLLLSQSSGSIMKVRQSLPNLLNSTNQFVYALPFISGARTYDLYMNLTFINANFNATTHVLAVDMFISYQKYPLQNLYVSYLIFNVASDLQISSLFDTTLYPSNINIFLGISIVNPLKYVLSNYSKPIIGLGQNAAQRKAFNLMFGIDGIVIQTQQSFDILYQPLSKNVSQSLTKQTLYCISKSSCFEKGGVMIYEQLGIFDISESCQICMKNAYYNQDTSSCVCLPDFTESQGACINSSQICSSNETYSFDLKKCTCKNLYVNVNGVCLSLINFCPPGQIYFQGKCITIVYTLITIPTCQDGYLFIDNICVKMSNCTPPMELDFAINQCQCPNNTQLSNNSCVACSVNETWIDYSCKCKSGYVQIQNKCLMCSINGYFDGVTCVCSSNYFGDGFTCLPNPSALNSSADSNSTRVNSSREIFHP